MRWLGFAWLVFCVSCRPRAGNAPLDGAPGPASGDAETREPSAAASNSGVRFARPIAAARWNGVVAVVARERATGELAFAKADDRAAITRIGPLPIGLDDPELVGSARAFGVLARASGDGGDARVLLRFGPTEDAGTPERAEIGSAACATEDGVYTLAREKIGSIGSFYPLDDTRAGPTTLTLSGKSESTIVCGQHRAFVVLSAPGELSAVAWTKAEHDDRATALPKPPTAGDDEDTVMAAIDDALVVVKLARSVVHTLVWTGGKQSTWRKSDPIAKEGLALEAIEAERGKIGLLFVRTIGKAKGCPAGETTDAVAEVAIVDAETGKLVRAPESLETWRCGAEPGPFFSGWAGGKLVVAWPRGADAACTRAGVKRGGIGYGEVDPANGRARIGRLARPAETIAPAGCDATKCYAVALTRGADACGPSDAPESGRLEVIAYP